MSDTARKVWFTTQEAAEYTRYSVITIERAADKGEIPFAQRKRGAPRRFRLEHLDAWLYGEQLPAVSGL